ncbi:MAG TPA: hypothetical protein VEC36_04910 [Patescibacteria group bacterium]|nr:hypothetical protein [Patescibacteria group bacterium]
MKIFALILICLIANIGCSSSQDTHEIELATCKKALKYIAEKDYSSLKNLFPDEVSQRLNDSVFRYQVDAGAEMIRAYGIPDEKNITKQIGELPVFNPSEGVEKMRTISGSSYLFPFPAGHEKSSQYISFMFFGGNPKWISSMTIMNEDLLKEVFKKLEAAEGRPKKEGKPFRKVLKFNADEINTILIGFSGYDNPADSNKRLKSLNVIDTLKKFSALNLKKDFTTFLDILSKAKISKAEYLMTKPFYDEQQYIRIGCDFSDKDTTSIDVFVALNESAKENPDFNGYIVIWEFQDENIFYYLEKKENAELVRIMKKISIDRYDDLKEFNEEE